MSPQRIQRKRSAGWRMPEGAVYVGRPSQWGNPFDWRTYPSASWPRGCDEPVSIGPQERRRQAVADYFAAVRHGIGNDGSLPLWHVVVASLRGRDLACWCPLDQPCHADRLLEIANDPDLYFGSDR